MGNRDLQARRYTSSDKEIVDSWYKSRNQPSIPDHLLPAFGAIVDGHAAGFLYVTDGGIALIENYITPEGISHFDRSEALDLVTECLIKKAEELNVVRVMCLTQSQAIYERAVKFGFDDIGSFRVLGKNLLRGKK